jgi:transposase
MQITPRERLLRYAHLLQNTLFGLLEGETGPLWEKARLLIGVLEMVPLSRQLPCARGWLGRPAKDRQALASAFVAKSVYGLETTRQLRERLRTDQQLRCLCGWTRPCQIPHESTFSRAFQEFAESELPQRLHEALILHTQQGRLVGHIARDATAIEARERFEGSRKNKSIPKRKRGRPRKCERALSGRRLPRQRRQTVTEMLEELPRHCSLGVKKSSKGYQQYWRGYKLHMDVADGQIPITCLLTAVRLHDSQVAIPLATLTAVRVTSLYDLMDCAYDANEIRAHSRSLGHVPLISPAPRHQFTCQKVKLRKNSHATKIVRTVEHLPPRQLTWAEEDRMQERTMCERVFARLKDEFGGRAIRVRGATKIMAQLMFGVLALSVDQLLRLTG